MMMMMEGECNQSIGLSTGVDEGRKEGRKEGGGMGIRATMLMGYPGNLSSCQSSTLELDACLHLARNGW